MLPRRVTGQVKPGLRNNDDKTDSDWLFFLG